MFCEDRHRGSGDMERAECSPQGLQGCYDLRILTVSAAVEITKDDHFNEIEKGHGFLVAEIGQLTIELPACRHELHRQPLLLIIASGFEIHAVSRA